METHLVSVGINKSDLYTETRKEWRNLKFNKEILLLLIEKEEPPRYLLKRSDTSPVEHFYKRHMSSDNPIP